jgi:hypothetical protein
VVGAAVEGDQEAGEWSESVRVCMLAYLKVLAYVKVLVCLRVEGRQVLRHPVHPTGSEKP